MRAGDPDEHEAAEGVELNAAAAGLWHVCLIRPEGSGFLVVAAFVQLFSRDTFRFPSRRVGSSVAPTGSPVDIREF